MLYDGELEELEALKRQEVASAMPHLNVGVVESRREVIELPDTDDVREMARAATPAAIRALVDIVTDPAAGATVKVAAANALLDRAHGKAHQSSTVTGDMRLTVVCNIPNTPNSMRDAPIDVTPTISH